MGDAGSPACGCWGAELQGLRSDACGPLNDRNCRHFKSKFCADCRWVMTFPAKRVRVLDKMAAALLENRRSVGVWSHAPKSMDRVRYRIVNNTKDCAPPRLILFEKVPPSSVSWKHVDPAILDGNGDLQMCVSKGTAVPLQHVKDRKLVDFPPREHDDDDDLVDCALPDSPGSSTSGSPVPSRPASPKSPPSPPPPPLVLPKMCQVLVPSALIQLANEAMPRMRSRSPSPRTPVNPSVRAQRNRESAATSRERKRKYIAYLEEQVSQLERTVEVLQEENCFWKSLGVETYDETCPLVACAGFVT